MTQYILYHNANCSKSRAALEALKKIGIKVNIINYLETPPDKKTLQQILVMLDIPAYQLLRTGETQYKALNLDQNQLSQEQLIDLMVQYPKLIERPIFIAGNKAVIGRPLEKILELLDELKA